MILYHWKKRITMHNIRSYLGMNLRYKLFNLLYEARKIAETAGSVGITLLEKGVMSRVPKSRVGTTEGNIIQQL